MNIVIIEDERLTAEDLAEIITGLDIRNKIVRHLQSVKEAVQYFKNGPLPDLIFCDIELGDGSCFDIFRQAGIDVPVIFCTAFDQYALEAFRTNGIDYLLKPFTVKTVGEAFQKYHSLKRKFTREGNGLEKLVLQYEKLLSEQIPSTASLLVSWKDKIIPVRLAAVALFAIDFKVTQLITFSGKTYQVSQTLDELELICRNNFYRANRQYLVNRTAVSEVQQYHARKLFIKLVIEGDFDLTVSKQKVPEFLQWLKS